MKAKFITFRSNKDGTATLYFDKGLDKHALLDLEGKEVEIREQLKEQPCYQYENLLPIIRMIDARLQEEYERGKAECAEKVASELLGEQK